MKKRLPAEELDRRFDEGEDITEYLDIESASHINLEPKRVSVDVPAWMVQAIDRQAYMMEWPRPHKADMQRVSINLNAGAFP